MNFIYPINEEGDEYYANSVYINDFGIDIYARRKNGSEYYLTDGSGKEIPARDENLVPHYAMSKLYGEIYPEYNGKPYYLKNGDNDEFYAKNLKQNEEYPINMKRYAQKNSGEYFYAKLKNGDEYYYKDPVTKEPKIIENNSILQYAKKQNQEEIYPVISPYKPVYIHDADGNIIYAKDENGSFKYHNVFKKKKYEIYGKVGEKEQYIVWGNEMEIYAKIQAKEVCATNNGVPYYAKILKNGKWQDYLPMNEFGQPYFAEYKNKRIPLQIGDSVPIYYQKDGDGNEKYSMDGNVEKYSINLQNEPVYAKLSNLDDYFAKSNNENYYASFEEKEFYPRLRTRQQFYLKRGNKEIYAKNKNDEYYAKDANDKDTFAHNEEVEYYAKLENQKEIYPKNESKSEFYRWSEANEQQECAIDESNNLYYAINAEDHQFYPKKKPTDEKVVELNVIDELSDGEIPENMEVDD